MFLVHGDTGCDMRLACICVRQAGNERENVRMKYVQCRLMKMCVCTIAFCTLYAAQRESNFGDTF